MICFYHSADLDGHCSGAIIKKAYPKCKMVGIDYGQPFPWEKIEPGGISPVEVVMIDFSLQPYGDMVRLSNLCSLTWIDHHKSAIDDHNKQPAGDFLGNAILDSNFAACELAWKTFYPVNPMPKAVHLLGRYDIWKHAETPGALEFQYGMRRYYTFPDNPQAMEFWSDLFAPNADLKDIIEDGEAFLDYEKGQNAKFMDAYGFEVEFDGLRCIAANKGMGNSLTFESKWDPEKHDAMLMFAWKGGQWTVSLYSTKPDVDVSIVCKARGGGGHKGAAGFQCKELPFLPSL